MLGQLKRYINDHQCNSKELCNIASWQRAKARTLAAMVATQVKLT